MLHAIAELLRAYDCGVADVKTSRYGRHATYHDARYVVVAAALECLIGQAHCRSLCSRHVLRMQAHGFQTRQVCNPSVAWKPPETMAAGV
jgi:hypothetical protein